NDLDVSRRVVRMREILAQLQSCLESKDGAQEERALLQELGAELAAFDSVEAMVDVQRDECQRLLGRLETQHEKLRRATREAEDGENLIHALLETMPAGVIVVNAEGDIMMSNPIAQQILGAAPSQNVRKKTEDYFFVHPDGTSLAREARPLVRALEQREVVERQKLCLRRVDGETRTILAGAAPVTDHGERLIAAILVMLDVTEREQIRRELEAERAQLDAVIEHAPEGIVVTDAQARVLRANPVAEAIYQRPVPYGEDYPEHEVFDFHHPDGRPYNPRNLPLTRSALDGDVVREEELTMTWPDGQQRSLLVNTAPIYNEAGEIAGAIGVFQDITDRKLVQRTLRRYAERLEILHRTDRAILSALSAKEIATTVLPYLREVRRGVQIAITEFDFEAKEMILLGAYTRVKETRALSDKRVPLDQVWYLDHLQEGSIYTVEDMATLDVDSDIIPDLEALNVRSFTIFPLISQMELLGSLNVAVDDVLALTSGEIDAFKEIADQLAIGLQQARLRQAIKRHAERLERSVALRTAALQRSEARFRAIFDSAAIGIALIDDRGHIFASNPALGKLTGYSEVELEGMAFTVLMHSEDVEAAEVYCGALLAGERDYDRDELRLICLDGDEITTQITFSGVIGDSERPSFTIAMVEDITERKTAQRELLHAEKLSLTGRLAASLAHEINNPLQTVIGALGLAREVLAEGEDPAHYLEVSAQELERAAKIVSDLRDLNRRSRPEDKEPVDINALIERVITLTEKQCRSNDVVVVWAPTPVAPEIRLVPNRIQQVVLNLILNAVDAMPEGGQLKITSACTYDPDGARITFSDTGVGIVPEELSQIFDAFYTNKSEGLGLGLYVTASIVEEHDGHIEVESEPGAGATFTVWLPA
ncbi:MAG: PAS domain S-box protein, partial [Anaerolineales bacterium]